MKLRISGNSLRLRLTRSEVEEFASAGAHESSLDIGGSRFAFRLEKIEDTTSLSAALADNTITVHVPASAADRWTHGDDVAVDAPTSADLQIVIEKDFACLKPRPGEDSDDHYPHPEVAAVC
jgi:hypothetical protein